MSATVRIAGRSYELLSASVSLSDAGEEAESAVDAEEAHEVPVDASMTSLPPAYDDDDDASVVSFVGSDVGSAVDSFVVSDVSCFIPLEVYSLSCRSSSRLILCKKASHHHACNYHFRPSVV